MASRRLGPYPTPTWADRVESILRNSFAFSVVLALFKDGSWGAVILLGLAAAGWAAGMAVRAR